MKLKSHLIVLVLAAVLPLLIFGATMFRQHIELQREIVNRAMSDTARALSLAADPIAHLFDRLSLWFNLKSQGFFTPPEEPEPSRSDCHGWGSHPLFHYYATILGIRPAAPHFREVQISPNLGHLTHARGTIPHPNGVIEVHLEEARRESTLPPGTTGIFRARNQNIPLHHGLNTLVPTSIS